MYLEHFHLNQSPFSEEPDPEVFFPEAGRDEMIRAMQAEILAGKPLIKVTGSEGSGKTMLCRRLLAQLDDRKFNLVYIDNPVGSFDDLLHVVCLDLGMDPATVPDRDMLSELRSLLAAGKERGMEVVLIVDEAEKLFLAALERLMRAICDVGGDYLLHIVLVGRPALKANLDQLTVYCSAVDINSGYTLEALSQEETARYLHFRLMAAGLPQDSRDEIFTDGAVKKIFESAHGNLRLINILAEEALQASCTDKSFLVLLDHVDETGRGSAENPALRGVASGLLSKKTFFIAGGALAVVLLLVFFFTGNEEKNSGIVSIPGHQIETPQPPENKEYEQHEELAPEAEVPSPQGDTVVAVVEETPEFLPEPAVIENAEEIVDIHPGRIKTAPPADVREDREIRPSEREVPAEFKPAVSASVDQAGRSGERLFEQRMRASAKWLASAYHNRYTVQLMMLASEQASVNIKKVLVEDDYYSIKDNLYILTKKTSPPTLFVFYGTYDSMEQARQARNNMPLFLRKHHPYALSISDAMKKTED